MAHEPGAAMLGIVHARQAAIGEMLEVPLQQVLGGQPGDRLLVVGDSRHAREIVAAAQVDGRQAHVADLPGELGAFDAGDDAVAAPTFHPARGGVGGDPAQQRAARRPGRFDQQGDAKPLGHFRPVIGS